MKFFLVAAIIGAFATVIWRSGPRPEVNGRRTALLIIAAVSFVLVSFIWGFYQAVSVVAGYIAGFFGLFLLLFVASCISMFIIFRKDRRRENEILKAPP